MAHSSQFEFLIKKNVKAFADMSFNSLKVDLLFLMAYGYLP